MLSQDLGGRAPHSALVTILGQAIKKVKYNNIIIPGQIYKSIRNKMYYHVS